jgi:hypothetical protein
MSREMQMTWKSLLEFFFAKRIRVYYVVGPGIPAEETACEDLAEAVGMAAEFSRSRHIEAAVCELVAKVTATP